MASIREKHGMFEAVELNDEWDDVDFNLDATGMIFSGIPLEMTVDFAFQRLQLQQWTTNARSPKTNYASSSTSAGSDT